MKTVLLGAFVVPLILLATPAAAQNEDGGFMLGVTGGSLGIGPEVGYRLNRKLGVRANATFLNLNQGTQSDGVEYDGSLELQSFGGMVDLYPFGGGFRVSGGARVSQNEVSLLGTPTGTVEIGEALFTAAQVGTLTGRVEAADLAPTATIGWGGGLTRGIKLGIDVGVMFQGTPRVTQLSASGTASTNPALTSALLAERAEIEEDISGFKYYPIVQISLGYRF